MFTGISMNEYTIGVEELAYNFVLSTLFKYDSKNTINIAIHTELPMTPLVELALSKLVI
jgi:hypothetical protein